MKPKPFICWAPEYYQTVEDGRRIESKKADLAAELFARLQAAKFDECFDVREIYVLDTESNETHVFHVRYEYVQVFKTTPAPKDGT